LLPLRMKQWTIQLLKASYYNSQVCTHQRCNRWCFNWLSVLTDYFKHLMPTFLQSSHLSHNNTWSSKADVDKVKEILCLISRSTESLGVSAAEAEYSQNKVPGQHNWEFRKENFPSEDTGVLSKFEILNPCTCDQWFWEGWTTWTSHALLLIHNWNSYAILVITNYTQFRSSFVQLSELVYHHLSTPFHATGNSAVHFFSRLRTET
jgi:hypothetical protein